MRVGIVNDLSIACEALRRVVASDAGLSVAWIARDGAEAVACVRRDRPDVVLMDLIMPRMDGVESTRRIMRESPCPILVVTATVSGNASLVYEALGAGALDAVNTPTLGANGVAGGEELLRRIHRIPRIAEVPRPAPALPEQKPRTVAGAPIVAVGASTGGPAAIAAMLRALPADFAAPVLVVQHLSGEFVPGFVEWLALESKRRVTIARQGDAPEQGAVFVASGEGHLALDATGRFVYRSEPNDAVHRPSVDEMFASLATRARPGIAVLLTGMGRDGAAGMTRLRAAGWHTIAQDERSSVVWGMPGAAVRAGAAVETLPVESIGAAIAAAARRLERGG